MRRHLLNQRVTFEAAKDKGKEKPEDDSLSEAQKKEIGAIVAESLKTVMPEVSKSLKKSLSEETAEAIKTAVEPLTESMSKFNEIIEEVNTGEEHDDDDTGDEDFDFDDDDDTGDDDVSIKTATKSALKQMRDGFKSQFNEYKETTDARIQELTDSLKEKEDEANQVRQREVQNKVSTELTKALSDLDVVSVDGATKFFQESVSYDEETGKVVYKNGEDEVVSLQEGLEKAMPDWLKKAKGKPGSDSKPGSVNLNVENESPLDSQIQALTDQVDEARLRAEESGQDNDLAALHGLTHQLNLLKSEKESGSQDSQI